jgi:hypothetical protein
MILVLGWAAKAAAWNPHGHRSRTRSSGWRSGGANVQSQIALAAARLARLLNDALR